MLLKETVKFLSATFGLCQTSVQIIESEHNIIIIFIAFVVCLLDDCGSNISRFK